MRLMANIRLRATAGLYEYRRVMPECLRDHLPPVIGFSAKPDRIEFTKSLATRNVREANRTAAAIDTVVDAAFAEAERRAAGSAPSVVHPESAGRGTGVHLTVGPQDAFHAIDRWTDRATRDARLHHFNVATAENRFGTETYNRRGNRGRHWQAQGR